MKVLVFVLAYLTVSLASPVPIAQDDDNNDHNSARSAVHHAVHVVRYFYDHRGLDGYKFT